MSLQQSVSVRNARLDAIESAIGADPVMELWDGDMPANCAAASAGTLIARGTLPSDWMTAAAAGSKAKNGTWTLTGLASGHARYFRISRAGSPSECDLQGTVGPAGSPTYDATVDNTSVAAAQVITVATFAITAANA